MDTALSSPMRRVVADSSAERGDRRDTCSVQEGTCGTWHDYSCFLSLYAPHASGSPVDDHMFRDRNIPSRSV